MFIELDHESGISVLISVGHIQKVIPRCDEINGAPTGSLVSITEHEKAIKVKNSYDEVRAMLIGSIAQPSGSSRAIGV